jgi:hypothetical protein
VQRRLLLKLLKKLVQRRLLVKLQLRQRRLHTRQLGVPTQG